MLMLTTHLVVAVFFSVLFYSFGKEDGYQNGKKDGFREGYVKSTNDRIQKL